MHYYEKIEFPVFYDGKVYPQDVFWNACHDVDCDKKLEQDIQKLEEDCLKKHLARRMKEREEEDEELERLGLR